VSGFPIALALGVFGAALCNAAAAKTVRFDAADHVLTSPMAINASQWIVGDDLDWVNGVMHAFLRSPGGEITSIDVDGSTCGTFASGMNRRGAIVGHSCIGDRNAQGFLRSHDGALTTITVPGAVSTTAYSINNAGLITGSYWDADGVSHGYLRATDGAITEFDPSGSTSTYAGYINKAGAIAGDYLDESGVGHGFLRAPDGTFTTFDAPVPGASIVGVVGLNDRDEVVFYVANDSEYNSFLRRTDGTVVKIGIGPGYFATAINNKGVVVGYYADELSIHGFIRRTNGAIRLFDLKFAVNTLPFTINDRGDIAGEYEDNRPGEVLYTHGFGILHKD
jgi:hypothetical protein